MRTDKDLKMKCFQSIRYWLEGGCYAVPPAVGVMIQRYAQIVMEMPGADLRKLRNAIIAELDLDYTPPTNRHEPNSMKIYP